MNDQPHPIEAFQDRVTEQINIERDQKAFLETFEHLKEANQHWWLAKTLHDMARELLGK